MPVGFRRGPATFTVAAAGGERPVPHGGPLAPETTQIAWRPDLVMAGRHEEKVQDESRATYEGWMHDEECEIHWPGHVDTIYNLIRACNPAPGAWMMLQGVKVRVYDCRKHVVGRFVPGGHKPGDIAGVTEESIVVWAQGGLIEILKLRPEGAGKMGAGDFARQQGLPISDAWRSCVRPARA